MDVVARFKQPRVTTALQEQLGDENKPVRRKAVESLMRMDDGHDIGLIAGMLRDPDLEVQNKTVDLLVQLRHPDTIKYLVDIVQDENAYTRRSAVEVLNEIAEPATIGHLFEALRDEDWWVSTRAGDALAEIGGPKVIQPVLELVSHDDERIRRAAVEILIKAKDEQAVAHLIGATTDPDWWVRERAVDALGEIGSPKAVPSLLKLLSGETKLLPAVIRALGKTGDEQLVPRLLPLALKGQKGVAVAAIHAVTALAGDNTAERVRAAVQEACGSKEVSVAQAAAEALGKFKAQDSIVADQIEHTRQVAANAGSRIQAPSPVAPSSAQLASISPGAEAQDELDITTLEEGAVFGDGRYVFLKKIGKGAFGTVLLVEDTVVDEQVILKFLNQNVSADEEMLKRFVHELRYSRKITHRNVIRIYDFVHFSGVYAISMEYFMRMGHRYSDRYVCGAPGRHHPPRPQAGQSPDQR
jgi:serine/threonine-protein kinase